MSLIVELMREAFKWLEGEGFHYMGEEDLPSHATSTFERRPVAVLVHWDGRDHATWTELARGPKALRGPPERRLGLGHLHRGGPPAILLPDPVIDPAPLRAALEWDSRLLRERGSALLMGEPDAWAELARLQELHAREATR